MKKKSRFVKTLPFHFAIQAVSRAKRNPIRMSVLILMLLLGPQNNTNAQDIRYTPLKISSVAAQSSVNGTTVSIVAEGSLRRAQTWRDSEGYHVVVPYATAQGSVKPLKGVKIRRSGQSLEFVLQIQTGTSVSAQVDDNRLNLFVDGSLESGTETSGDPSKVGTDENSSDEKGASPEAVPFTSQFPNQPSAATGKADTPAQPRPDLRVSQGSEQVPPPSQVELQPEQESLFTSIFSAKIVLLVLVLGAIGLFVSRKLGPWQKSLKFKVKKQVDEVEWEETPEAAPSLPPPPQRQPTETKEPVVQPTMPSKGAVGTHIPVATPDSLYGAYRIDQEVGKLVLGQPHRTDVLSSRAPDDRRAIEASLIRIIASTSDEEERRRASEALEEYGFVARECALLLMAANPFDRTNAARALGEIKSPSALPFLLEGLYDSESIVRNQVVASIGELKVPRAIGALLDMARRHPDVPGKLVSEVLSACSVEGMDFFDTTIPALAILGDNQEGGLGFEIGKLEPATLVEELPEESEDESFAPTMEAIKSENVGERLEAAKTLARFEVSKSVSALITMARSDPEAAARSQAVTSLASINHESVFPAVLIAMADEAREVRASAARSLTHLNFDRTDAYVRVLQSDDEELRVAVAKACIKAGIVSQGIDRLATGDRRQAHETFSIISLLASANVTEPVLDAIVNHPNLDIRLALVKLLVSTGQQQVFEQLRQLAVREDLPEELRTTLLEAMYQLDQSTTGETEDYAQTPGTDEISNETHADSYGDIVIAEGSAPTLSPAGENEL